MTPKELVLTQLQSSAWLFDEFTKDFTDEDAKFKPHENTNHLNWILAHVATSEDSMVSKLSGKPTTFSEETIKKYGGGSTCSTDDGLTLGDAQKMFHDARARTVEFVKTFDEARYDDKAPEGMPPIFPNAGSVVGLLATHAFWHFGQLSVNRRALNKPAVLTG